MDSHGSFERHLHQLSPRIQCVSSKQPVARGTELGADTCKRYFLVHTPPREVVELLHKGACVQLVHAIWASVCVHCAHAHFYMSIMSVYQRMCVCVYVCLRVCVFACVCVRVCV